MSSKYYLFFVFCFVDLEEKKKEVRRRFTVDYYSVVLCLGVLSNREREREAIFGEKQTIHL